MKNIVMDNLIVLFEMEVSEVKENEIIINNEKNRGLGAVRNIGIERE